MNESEGSRFKQRAVIEFLIARECSRRDGILSGKIVGENARTHFRGHSRLFKTRQERSINRLIISASNKAFLRVFPKNTKNARTHIIRQSLKFTSQPTEYFTINYSNSEVRIKKKPSVAK